MLVLEQTEGNEPLPSDLPSRTDQDLIAAANRGDFDAFEELYRRYRDWAVKLALRFTRDEDLALDVLQETFIYFLKKFPGFQLRCELKTFLYPAVRNLALNMRRKSDRYISDPEGLSEIPVPPASADSSDVLMAIVQSLPEQQREVVLLRFVDGLALNEIATALEIPLGTVKSRLHNALATLEQNPQTKTYFQ